MASRRRRPPRVALLVETTRTYTRELLAGVRRYVAAHGPWSCFIELRALESGPPPWLKNWDGDGIITRTFTQEMADVIAATGLPAVELRATFLKSAFPFVGMDNRLIGQMVAEHFFDRGYQSFAVYSLHTERFFVERVQNFVAAVQARGGACSILPEPVSDRAADWEKGQARLISWLTSLPKPVGIFAANDQLGVRVLDACQRAGIAVPEDVAVVGAENEETLCAFVNPPLTSVRFDGAAVGFAAAELLARMMCGGAPPKGETLFPPKGIVVRGSSDEFVITDRLVAHAARVIRENATTGLNVDDLCRKLNASRSTLDRRMRAALGRTPKEEILHVRFREVERLLRETDLTIEAIAEQTGFAYSHYLQAAFKQVHGLTPGEFRRRSQAYSTLT
ncbi:MAG: DNA-binding transcriptional regulator [Opitutus sp.]|nr:DNA-binding transcriptional regulator [Opitutus sp.]